MIDWAGVVERNREILARVIADLFKIARIAPGERPELDRQAQSNIKMTTLPRYAYNAAMLILVPAEAAMRRLIIIAAHQLGLDLAAAPSRPSPPLKPVQPASAQTLPAGAWNPLPAPLNCTKGLPFLIRSFEVHRVCHLLPSPPKTWPVRLSFDMFDPLKNFDAYWRGLAGEPAKPFPDDIPPSVRFAPVDAVSLWQRINALHMALVNLEGEARRYARWEGRSAHARANNLVYRPRRNSLMRPGLPPGQRPEFWRGRAKDTRHEVYDLLKDLHQFAREVAEPQRPPPRQNAAA